MEGVLLDQENRQLLARVEFADRVEDLAHDDRRKSERGLIQQKEARARHQGTGDRQHLLLAAGERAAALMQPLLQAREELEHLLAVRVEMLTTRDHRAHLQVFQYCHPREDAPAFRRLRNTQMRDLVRRKMYDVVPVEHDRAFARTRIAEDRHHEGRLTGAIRTDQRDDLAVRNIEVNIPQRLNLSVKRGDAAHGQEGSHSPTSASTFATSSSSTPR